MPGRKLGQRSANRSLIVVFPVILGDTCDSSGIAPLAAGADVLVHESTFPNEMADLARFAGHSSAGQLRNFSVHDQLCRDGRQLRRFHWSPASGADALQPSNFEQRGSSIFISLLNRFVVSAKQIASPSQCDVWQRPGEHWLMQSLIPTQVLAADDFMTLRLAKPQQLSWTAFEREQQRLKAKAEAMSLSSTQRHAVARSRTKPTSTSSPAQFSIASDAELFCPRGGVAARLFDVYSGANANPTPSQAEMQIITRNVTLPRMGISHDAQTALPSTSSFAFYRGLAPSDPSANREIQA